MPAQNKLDICEQNAETVPEELAQELRSIQERFRQAAPSTAVQKRELALLRLCPGLTQDQWAEISQRLSLEHWISMPLESDVYPQLRRLQ